MESFFFGGTGESLYGVYHAPSLTRQNSSAVLLCPPFGQEALRAHKSFRYLAEGLAKVGHHVLRFDYRGQGDSSGDITHRTAQDWQRDIAVAAEELCAISGAQSLTLLGLRLGALLAATAQGLPVQAARLMLWDPCVTGEQCVQEWRAIGLPLTEGHALAVNGFLLPESFSRSVAEFSLLQSDFSRFARVDLMMSHEDAAFAALDRYLAAGFQQRANVDAYRSVVTPAPHDWNYVDSEGAILWPVAIMQAILQQVAA